MSNEIEYDIEGCWKKTRILKKKVEKLKLTTIVSLLKPFEGDITNS